jgi:hypothetical protein
MLRAKAGLPELFDVDDLPDPAYDPNYVHVLTEEEQSYLHRRLYILSLPVIRADALFFFFGRTSEVSASSDMVPGSWNRNSPRAHFFFLIPGPRLTNAAGRRSQSSKNNMEALL